MRSCESPFKFLEHQHACAVTTSGKRGGQAGGAGAKHDYVEFFCHYYVPQWSDDVTAAP